MLKELIKEKREISMNLRIKASEKSKIKDQAKAHGVSMVNWIIYAATKYKPKMSELVKARKSKR